MFNVAGMQPLMPYLLGKPHPQGKRLCNIQGCVRTVDIDSVGDASHFTFFEMITGQKPVMREVRGLTTARAQKSTQPEENANTTEFCQEYLKEVAAKNPAEIPAEIEELAKARWQAKQNKNWAQADSLRTQIDALGYLIKDGKDSFTIILVKSSNVHAVFSFLK